MHIQIKGYPMLKPEPPPEHSALCASDVMAPRVVTVNEVERVRTLVHILQSTSHHGFPVTCAGGGDRVLGVILRDQLMAILNSLQAAPSAPGQPQPLHSQPAAEAGPSNTSGANDHDGGGTFSINGINGTEAVAANPTNFEASTDGPAGPEAPQMATVPALSADDFSRPWTVVSIDALAARLSPHTLEQMVSLRPYVNEAAGVTLASTSVRRASRHFLAMGLRHLLVIESCPRVVGIITRQNLLIGGAKTEQTAAANAIAGAPAPASSKTSDAFVRFRRMLRWGSRLEGHIAPPNGREEPLIERV